MNPGSTNIFPGADLPRLVNNPLLNFRPDPGKTNDLADLIDLAQRANPQTREAWEQARAAAARLGLADSAYLPLLALLADGGYARNNYPNVSSLLVARGPAFSPGLSLEWTLLDFGRRRAVFDAAAQGVLQANFQFNRIQQQVAYAVERAFFAFDSSRARVEAAVATLKTARTVEQAASLRLDNGLATQSDLLQARQERASAEFDLQSAQRTVSDTWATLAESLGISPMVSLPVVSLAGLPIPTNLMESVEATVDQALRQRPDLAAQLAELHAREAEVRRAQAEYYPKISASGTAGGNLGNFDITTGGETFPSFNYAGPQYGAFLNVSWDLFDGLARRNKLREAEARRREAEAALSALELKTFREVWTACADVKASFQQYNYAQALLTASEDDSESALTSYQNGLGTAIELLTAERDLARARTIVVESRAEVLTTSAALAFAVGEGNGGPAMTGNPANGKGK